MAVSTFPTWRSREGEQRHLNNWRSWYEVRASGAGGESYLVLKKDFADEEDYTEAGDSELFFVQVQRKKSIDKKSKLADKVILSLLLLVFSVYVLKIFS